MIFILSLCVCSLFLFTNSLFFVIVLLFVSIFILSVLVVNSFIGALVSLMVVLVYVGAIMVVIGYVCAVCPNIEVESHPYALRVVLFFPFVLFLFSSSLSPDTLYSDSLVNFFYSYHGCAFFFRIAFILFVTLLIVTSQYLTPIGPFRSVA